MPSASKSSVKPKAKKHPLKNLRAFQKALCTWFEKEGKDYPWRQTIDPWAILVSEIMLQQTQVKTVLEKGHYKRFMTTYPSVKSMAEASEQGVLRAWEGLGYYRRAKNLHSASRAILREHNGIFPKKFEQVRALPGIGRYTAGALCSFAYDDPQPIVDANVTRVFSRLFNYQKRIDTTSGQHQIWDWAEELLPQKNARIYNSALMELGQNQCKNKSVNCPSCPVKSFCQSEQPLKLPIKKPSVKITRVEEFAIFSVNKKKEILLEKSQKGARREGMWHLPRREYKMTDKLSLILKTSYAITRYKVTLRIYACPISRLKIKPDETWHSLAEIEHIPMTSPDRRALSSLLKGKPF